MFGLSGEHLVVLAIVLIVFGPKRLPQLGNTMGKAIKNFKDAVGGVEEARFRRIEEEEKLKTAATNLNKMNSESLKANLNRNEARNDLRKELNDTHSNPSNSI
jgi:sec-independent protein translocase protein TatA